MSEYDVIVIGSGAGGLGAAVALSNVGKKVLVLEQHYLPGGWCHTFALEGHKFSPGVHYIGELHEEGRMRAVLEGLGVGPDIEFCELNPDGYDHVVFDDEIFDIPKGEETFRERLCRRFPNERDGIQRYFRLMRKVDHGLTLMGQSRGLFGMLKLLLQAPALIFNGRKPASEVIDRYVKDPKLKAILEARAGDHGMTPAKVPFGMHVAIEGHYWEGAWFPKGGGGAIPRAFIKRLKKNGGQIRTRARVDRILIEGTGEGRRAVGVRMDDGEEIRAETVLSNADVWATYKNMLGKEELSEELTAKVDRLKPSLTALSLFLAADIDADALGLDSGNYWLLRDADVDAAYRQAEDDDLSGDGPFAGGFLTITTKKDPSKMHDGIHTMEAFTFIPYKVFEKWQGSDVENRPEDYQAFKKHLIERMLDTIERVIPGVREHVKLCELGTPLTNDFYVNSYRGNLYGTAKTWSQIGPGAPSIRTEIPGLFHCGQSTSAHGVLGSMFTGVIAAAKISGKSMEEILAFSDEGKVRCNQPSAVEPERTPVGAT